MYFQQNRPTPISKSAPVLVSQAEALNKMDNLKIWEQETESLPEEMVVEKERELSGQMK